jgi:outer membrane protein OmpA-like peptidoglycan-associated protein
MLMKSPILLLQLLFFCAVALCQNTPDKNDDQQIDINTASEQEIAALPQVGSELAKKIVKNRPYASIDDLAKAGVPAALREMIKSKIKVSRTQSEKAGPQGGRIAQTILTEPGARAGSSGSEAEEAIARFSEELRRTVEAAVRAEAMAEDAQRAANRAMAEASQAKAEASQARAAAERARTAMAAESADRVRLMAEASADRLRMRAEQDQIHLRQQLQEQLNSVLQTRDAARGLIVNMSDVLFDEGRYTLRPGAREKLAKISGIILGHPGLQISIEGHTDSIGSDEYNLKLSENRAAAVRDFLVTQGVPPTVVAAFGFGKQSPVADNSTAAGRQQNRRVELVISGEVLGQRMDQTLTGK